MHDSKDFVETIKRIAVAAVMASKPTALHFGKVISISPLKINVEQKMTLTSAQLVLTRNVKDYTTKVTVSWTSEAADNHTHQMTGKKEITVHNALEVDDEVIMISMPGGQRFIVIDRL